VASCGHERANEAPDAGGAIAASVLPARPDAAVRAQAVEENERGRHAAIIPASSLDFHIDTGIP
jgi:hypothetical protein